MNITAPSQSRLVVNIMTTFKVIKKFVSGSSVNIIETQKQKGYHLKQAKVNFIVYWKKEDAENESKIILPELYFQR